MQRAIAETDRRREVQIGYNAEHGITPKGIQKSINDVMEAGGSTKGDKRRGRQGAGKGAVAEREVSVENLSAAQLAKRMKELEKQMYDCARNLEFERAASLRDELEHLRAAVFKGSAVTESERKSGEGNSEGSLVAKGRNSKGVVS